MNQKLEQLRKRYVNLGERPESSDPYTLDARSSSDGAKEVRPDRAPEIHSPPNSAPMPPTALAEQGREVGQPAVEEPQTNDLTKNVKSLFEPADRFREHVHLSFEAILSLRAEFIALAHSAKSLKGLQGGIMGTLDSIRKQIEELAATLEAARTMRVQLSALSQVLEDRTELESQFHDLSRMLDAVLKIRAQNRQNSSETKKDA
jgi:hypothetical protein